tara:strand:- start:3230 stop:3769 length:540 start_codon:yes stop_codon:yes gene_type:complete
MNILDLTNISTSKSKSISVLGFGEISSTKELLKGMVNSVIEPLNFDIQIEPNPHNQNFIPKAIDIVNESKNRFNMESKFLSVSKSTFKSNGKITIINSFLNTSELISNAFSSADIGNILIFPLFNTSAKVKSDVEKFVNEQKVELSFLNSKEIPYLIKSQQPLKKFTIPKILRTKSKLT